MLDESKQGVNYRLANIVAELPEVRAMFPVMTKEPNDGAQKAIEKAIAVWRERGLMSLRQSDYNAFLDRTVLKAWRERRSAFLLTLSKPKGCRPLTSICALLASSFWRSGGYPAGR